MEKGFEVEVPGEMELHYKKLVLRISIQMAVFQYWFLLKMRAFQSKFAVLATDPTTTRLNPIEFLYFNAKFIIFDTKFVQFYGDFTQPPPQRDSEGCL